ncbi:binding-protein-dependent transport system inner membrane component [Nocardia puris]|uniref:Binding-protein-dependent transport system inner membrane component n=1 Tax=Nocardia puris TaxID=208602 RepID=A0A366DR61_9NOCA|nr:binding-protein-dependent transport system inner membrane component [Nocardia puris]
MSAGRSVESIAVQRGSKVRLRVVVPATLLLAVLAVVVLGPLLAPHPATSPVGRPFTEPSGQFPLGTDVVGRDVFSRLLHGGLSLVAITAAALMAAYGLGLALGLLAGLRRRADPWVSRPVDALVVVPWFLLLAVIATAMGPGPAAIVVTTTLAASPWIIRIVRTAVLEIAGSGYVEAARARGEPWWRVAVVEVLPNLRSVVLADAGIRVSGTISMVAVSGFLGLGLRPPSADWALMITENRPGFVVQPWSVLAPAALVMVLVVSVNLLVDGLLGGHVPPPSRLARLASDPDAGLAVSDLDVHDRHGRAVLEGVSLSVARGRSLAVVGPSGAGKTTFASAVLGALPRGLRATGVITTPVTEGLRTVGYVPQDPAAGLNPALRIGTSLREIARLHDRRAGASVVAAALERVGLPGTPEFRRRYPHELSGGQQQRVLLAMALTGNPALIVLDEPTTGLDPRTRADLVATLTDIKNSTTATFLIVTHDLAGLAPVVDDVAEFDQGKLVSFGPTPGSDAEPGESGPVHLAVRPPVGNALTPGTRQCDTTGAPPPSRGDDATEDTGTTIAAADQPGRADAVSDDGPVTPHGASAGEPCGTADVSDGDPGLSEGALGGELIWAGGTSSRAPGGASGAKGVVPGRAGGASDAESNRGGGGPGVESVPTGGVAAREPGAPVLRVTGLSVAHGRWTRVLDNVDFAVAEGECLAIVGRSGVGKTTVARALAGLHAPTAGHVEFEGGRVPASVDRRTIAQRRAIQLVFQNPATSLNPVYPVGAQVRRTLRLLHGLDHESAQREARRLFASLHLDEALLDRRPGRLSGGQQQRVAVARALAARPGVLICDEITASLDIRSRAAVLDLLDDLRGTGLAMILISHQPEVVARLADRTLTLDGGRLHPVG